MKHIIKEWAFKRWYWYVSNVDKNSEILLMNYGYSSPEQKLELEQGDELHRYSIQLYHQLVNHIDVKGKDLVEIGCGRGGGLSFIHRYFKPASSLGIDLNHRAMKFANSFYNLKGLGFLQGDAQNIPVADESCDVVLNVESSHRYLKIEDFFSEVKRILRPEGFFIMTDFRLINNYPLFLKHVEESGFKILKHDFITPNVVEALKLDDARRRNLVNTLVPFFVKNVGLNFAGAIGSPTFNRFANGEYHYFNVVMQKI